MRTLVTGGSGFIGSHVIDALVAKGHEVSVYDVRPPHRNDVKFVHGDLTDFTALSEAMSKVQATYHLAAVSNINDVYADPLLGERVNSGGTTNVLEACRKHDVERLIYASTVWVYDQCSGQQPFSEEQQLAPPKHLYTATKVAGEFYCHSYHDLYGLGYVILRYGIPYGPRGRRGTVITNFLEKALNNEPLTVYGKGENYRYFLYIDDLVSGNVMALKKEARNQTYNLDGEEPISIARILATIEKILGKKLVVKHEPARPGEFVPPKISSEKARNELGWRQVTPFDVGMRSYITWLSEHVQ